MLNLANILSYSAKKNALVFLIAFIMCGLSIRVADGDTSFEGIVLLTALISFTFLNYRLRRDVLYPGFMMSAIWTFTVFVYVFSPLVLNPLSWKSVFILSGGVASFGVGSWVGDKSLFKAQLSRATAPRRNNSMGVLLLLLYSAITLPLFVIDTARIAATPFAISPDFFIAARSAVVESLLEQSRVYSSRIVSSAPLLAIFGCFVTLIEERSRWIRWGALLIAACLGILTTGRVALLLFFSGWLTISLLERSDRSIVSVGRRLAYVVLAVALVFTLLTFLSKSETQGKGKIAVASELTIAYIAGPIAAFDYAVRNGNLFSGQMNNTFSDVMGPVLPAFGISYHPPPIVEPFVSVPIPVNVYTAFKPFYVDFGAFGCLVAFGTFGFMHGVLFRAASRGFRPAVFLLAGISYALIFTPFTDAYHHLFHYVYLIIYCALYFLALAKLPDFTLSIKRLRTPLTVENC